MIYFDNSATTKPYKEAAESYLKVAQQYFGNPSSLHGLGGQAEKLLKQAREQMAKLLRVQVSEVYFTSGGTEGNNLAIKGAAMQHRTRGKHLITTAVEHPSVKMAMEQLKELGFTVSYIPVDCNGRVAAADIEQALTKETILVSVMHVNNEIGTIQPLKEIGELLKQYSKVLFHVDYVQGAGKVELDIIANHIDLCTISGHKFHGLKGTGALYVRSGVQISPLLAGGSQEQGVRSGTENTAGIVAMAKALRLSTEKLYAEQVKMLDIKNYLMNELENMEGTVVNTPKNDSAPHIINFSLPGIKAEVVVHALEEHDIFVSTTSACSSKRKTASTTLTAMGVPEKISQSAIRISLSYDSTMDEAIIFIDALKKTTGKLRKVMNAYEF